VPTRTQTRAILVVEDEPSQARFLACALESFGYGPIHVAGTAERAIALAEEERPRLALVDISLGATDGVRVATHLCNLGVAIIYATGHSDDQNLKRAMATGPSGYLLKPIRVAELHAAVEIALHFRKPEDGVTFPEEASSSDLKPSLLSRREVEVLRELALGFTAKEIAAHLGIAKPTVETYRVRIAEKLGTKSKAELVAFATRMGLTLPVSAGS
jgi:DNA-binding NarL/FixJ family response regulator